jgi:hypothetical protein
MEVKMQTHFERKQTDPVSITIDGVTYDSINRAAMALKVSPPTITKWYKAAQKTGRGEITCFLTRKHEYVVKKVK